MTTRQGTVYLPNSAIEVMEPETEGRAGLVREGGAREAEQMEGGARRDGAEVLGGAGAAVSELSRMMQAMLVDRERREAEQLEERRRWELDRQLREEALREERRRREEELAYREEQTRRQMEVLQTLVHGIQQQGEAATKRAENDRDVKIPKLTEKDDIVSYLTMFERLMGAYEVKKEKWVFKLAAHLVGKAQEAYAALSTEDARSYEKVKEAILRRFDITEESYWQRFRAARKKGEESNRELVTRLSDFAVKWLKGYKSREEVLDQVILEQFLKTLPDDIRVFVKERRPATSKEAGGVADDYIQARKEGADSQKRDGDKSVKRCLQCGKAGHLAKDCWTKEQKSQSQEQKHGQATAKGVEICEMWSALTATNEATILRTAHTMPCSARQSAGVTTGELHPL